MWELFFKTPLLNLLIFFYQVLGHNLGLAIIALTFFLRLLLLPLTWPALSSAQKLKKLQPHLDKLKEKHGQDKTALAKAQWELYQEHGFNPLAGCLPLLLSLPVMLALYQVLLQALNLEFWQELNAKLYFSFLQIKGPEELVTRFLWFDLTKPDPFFILPLLVGVSQLLNAYLMPSPAPAASSNKKGESEELMKMIQQQNRYLFPLFSAFITLRLPAGVGLYWFFSTVFGIIQQFIINRRS